MHFFYITHDDEKSLSPFFSPLMSSITYNYIWILGAILLISWPHKSLYQYVQSHSMPLTFMGVFAASMIMISYIQIRCGRGEVFVKDSYHKMIREGIRTFEEENGFFFYSLPQSILHILFFLFLSLPILILAASISAVGIEHLLMALFIIFMSALVCRWFAFLSYFLLGRWSFWGYLLPRLFFILIFFITAFYNDFANPVLLLNLFFEGEVNVLQADMSRSPLFIVLSMSLSLVLGLSLHFLIKHSRGKEESV
jgi:hypothetical protein